MNSPIMNGFDLFAGLLSRRLRLRPSRLLLRSIYVRNNAQLKLQDGVDANQGNFVFQLHMIFRLRRTEAWKQHNPTQSTGGHV